MKTDNKHKIEACWQVNAESWIEAIRNNEIRSRRLVTNDAIINAVLSSKAKNIIDLGCGEGWLCRHFSSLGIKTTGIDGNLTLINEAKRIAHINDEYHHITIESFCHTQQENYFDAAVANFSLFDPDTLDILLDTCPRLLSSQGRLIIQTLHPGNINLDSDQWVAGDWNGFKPSFKDPAPWFYRTLSSWLDLFKAKQLELEKIIEPGYPEDKQKASIIFILRRA